MVRRLFAVVVILAASLVVNAAPTAGLANYELDGEVMRVNVKRQIGGARPMRRNILEHQKDIPAWSLYIQGLAAMQNMSESFILSYFQIAGIHGRPYTAWGNVTQAPGAPDSGYCTHNSPLFLPWHRPYLALYEQMMGGSIYDIATKYPNSNRAVYQAAASTFRIPYWDWASNPSMPDVVNQPKVSIVSPTGPQTIDNPLYQYKFHTFPLNPVDFPTDPNVAGDFWLAKYPYTVRGAATQGGPSNVAAANSALQNSQLMSGAYYALTKPTSFNEFGTTATPGTSLEGPHNNVHGAIGLVAGHMSILSYSAYDPIFWLHHVNVDRLFAMWQAVNPNLYITPQLEPSGSYFLAANTLDTASTQLKPFAPTGDSPFFTSTSARNIGTFGYTYPEINDWSQTPAQLKANVSAAINRMYNPNLPHNQAGGDIEARADTSNKQTKEWSVAIKVNKFDLDGERFIIRVFLGSVPQDSKTWATSSACVGSFPVFPPPKPATGPLPVVLAYSEVSLVYGLYNQGHDPQDVGSVSGSLKTGLQWRVQKFDGTTVPVEQIPSLTVTVQEEIVTPNGVITDLPKYGKKTRHPEVTKGRAGGYDGAA